LAIHLNVIGSGSLLGVCLRRAIARASDWAFDAGFLLAGRPASSPALEPVLRTA
jgi:hypothetical protein